MDDLQETAAGIDIKPLCRCYSYCSSPTPPPNDAIQQKKKMTKYNKKLNKRRGLGTAAPGPASGWWPSNSSHSSSQTNCSMIWWYLLIILSIAATTIPTTSSISPSRAFSCWATAFSSSSSSSLFVSKPWYTRMVHLYSDDDFDDDDDSLFQRRQLLSYRNTRLQGAAIFANKTNRNNDQDDDIIEKDNDDDDDDYFLDTYQRMPKIIGSSMLRVPLQRPRRKRRRATVSKLERTELPKWFRAVLEGSKITTILHKTQKSHNNDDNHDNNSKTDNDDDHERDKQGDEGFNAITSEEEEEEKEEEGAASSSSSSSQLSTTTMKEQQQQQQQQQQKPPLPGSRVLRIILSNPLVEFKLSLLVLLSSFFVAMGTIRSLPHYIHTIIDFGEDCIAFLFLIEYLLRWYCSKLKLNYLLRPMVLIDLLSILPLAFGKKSGRGGLIGQYKFYGRNVLEDHLLVNLRLLRLLRLQRFLVDLDTFERFRSSLGVTFVNQVRTYHLKLARALLSFFLLWTVSSGLIYTAEHVLNPAIPDFFAAQYFCLTTLMTVGFGDITPVTTIGRMVVIGTVLAGATIIPLQVTGFVEALIDFRRDVEAKHNAPTTTTINDADTDTDAQKGSQSLRNDENENDINEKMAYEVQRITDEDGNCRKVKTNVILACPVCKAKPHGIQSTFCWNCGSPLWAAARQIPVLHQKEEDRINGDEQTSSLSFSLLYDDDP